MEPADERREHLPANFRRSCCGTAPMEPADERWEHHPAFVLDVFRQGAPQWSPPTSGGSTPRGTGPSLSTPAASRIARRAQPGLLASAAIVRALCVLARPRPRMRANLASVAFTSPFLTAWLAP